MELNNQNLLNDKNVPAIGFSWFIAGAAFGSLITFLFDPNRGNYRRALIRDKGISFKRDTKLYGGKIGRDFANRAQGVRARLQKLGTHEEVTDDKLIARVRSAFGRIVSHPKSIDVDANNGVIMLSGQILESEVDDLLSCVEDVDGVEEIVDNLDVYDTENNIPGLQGKGPEYLSH